MNHMNNHMNHSDEHETVDHSFQFFVDNERIDALLFDDIPGKD